MAHWDAIPDRRVLALAAAGMTIALLLLVTAAARADNHCDITVSATDSIQAAVDAADPGDTICVDPGTYQENVTVDKDITLLSTGGKGVTIVEGDETLGGELGTILITGGTTGVQIGAEAEGFTIIGLDGPTGLEKAAIYLQGSHANTVIEGNEVVADGDAGLLTEFGATIVNLQVVGNEFSGQTFVGDTPAGNGFGDQFTLPNVPRQLVVISGGAGGGNHSSVDFRNNVISGVAGGINEAGEEQGNNLVTIDAALAFVDGNEFTGFTNRFAHSLRVRGPNNEITNNKFVAGSPVGLFVGDAAVGTSGVHGNCFEGNAVGLVSDGPDETQATNNWWGDPSGPGGDGPGTGDPVFGNVNFDPWLTDGCPLDPPPPPPENPDIRQDCMRGGWEDFGFRNQGLCIQFVNTGKDSR